jgi:hypothetical protein
MCVRIIISLSASDENNQLLIYLGIYWSYIDGNYVHIEVMFLLWTTNIIVFYLYVIHSPDKHNKWLELFAFLNEIISHKRIGKFVLIINFFKFLSNYMKT